MGHAIGVTLAPLALVAILDLWVFQEATRRAADGCPVRARVGQVVIETPAAWLVGCTVLTVVFLPMYCVARRY